MVRVRVWFDRPIDIRTNDATVACVAIGGIATTQQNTASQLHRLFVITS